ncbi:hypothetical protein UF06_16010 [Vibrio sp. S234-5]|nr:hypothetical protein UF06_16010 [Vibrio sp. S234-5]
MTSNNRDYRFLTPEETDEWEKVKQEEIVNPGSRVKIQGSRMLLTHLFIEFRDKIFRNRLN